MRPRTKGRLKPCRQCGKDFYCEPAVDVGGTQRERRYCDRLCYAKSLRGDKATSFWSKVNKDGPNGCWEWTASKQFQGYGQFLWDGKMNRAHRLAWEYLRGHIPAGKHVLHYCDNRICCNPEHMWLGTHQENMNDMKTKRRHTFGEANCHAKLKEEQVLAIRAEYKMTNRRRSNSLALANKYGVDQGTIHAIVSGRTWRHL